MQVNHQNVEICIQLQSQLFLQQLYPIILQWLHDHRGVRRSASLVQEHQRMTSGIFRTSED